MPKFALSQLLKAHSKSLGYFFGIMFSAAGAIPVTSEILTLLRMRSVLCHMSLGCTENETLRAALLLLGGYLLLIVVLALLARWLFKSTLVVALLLNASPLMGAFSVPLLSSQYDAYVYRSKIIRSAQNAINDAPAIHLGTIYVKKIAAPGGGVILFQHLPFTVTKPVEAQSLNILARVENSSTFIKYSANPHCQNDHYSDPTYGFDIVDREYIKSPLPPGYSGIKIVSEQLYPNQQYYLLSVLHFASALCKVSDFQDFNPAQLTMTLNVSNAEEMEKEPINR